LIEHGQETWFGFAEASFQIRNQTAAIIEEPEDDHALLPSGGQIHQHGAVQRIGLPEFSARGRLPAVSCAAIPLHAGNRQAVPAQQTLDTGPADLAQANPASQLQFPHDQTCRTAGIFPFHIHDQLLQLLAKNPAGVAILAGPWLERCKAALAVFVIPLLQRLVSDAACSPMVILIGLLGELFQR
jgi:hypothetical protein